MKRCIFAVVLLAISIGLTYAAQSGSTSSSLPEPGRIADASGIPNSTVDSGSTQKPTVASVSDKHEQRVRRIWFSTIAMMLVGTTADAATSWHKEEGNSLLASSNGTFGTKAIGIKIGFTAAMLVPQIILRHQPDLRRGFIIGNLVDAALFGGTAIHNTGVRVPQ